MAQAVDTQRLIATLEANFTKYDKALNRALGKTDRTFTKITRHGKRMESAMAKIGRRAFLPLTAQLTAALAPAAAFSAAMRTVSDASDLAKVADKIGIGVEALQRLQFGFERTGVAANTSNMALQRFSRRVGEAANGTGELFKVVEANNLQLRNQDGTMRSQVEILRDYAELIKNASSEQEQLALAFKAFDSEGAALVNALRDGAAGIDTLMAKANQAGGVLEEEMVRKAEEIDDRFASLWRRFEINAKSAILNSVTFLDKIKGAFDRVGIFAGDIRESFGGDFSNQARIQRGFFTSQQALSPEDKKLMEQLLARYSSFGGDGSSVVPSGSSTTSTPSANELERAIGLYEKRISLIEAETSALGTLNPHVDDYGFALEEASAKQQLLNAAQEAGVELTPEVRAQIDELANSYATASAEAVRLAESQEMARQKSEALRSALEQSLTSFINDLRQGESATQALANAFQRMADQIIAELIRIMVQRLIMMALTGSPGPPMGTSNFGSGPANFSGSAFSLFQRGGYTGNGPSSQPAGVVHGGEYVFSAAATKRIGVAELDRMHRTARAGANATVMSPGRGGGMSYAPIYNIDARGAQRGVAEEIKSALENFSRHDMPRRVKQIQRDPHAIG